MNLHINPHSPLAIRDESGEIVIWVEPPATLDNDSYVKMTKRAADFVRALNCHQELIAALEPIAREADNWLNSIHDDFRPLCVEPGNHDADGGGYAHPGSETFYTLGDLRRARAILAKARGETPCPA